MLGQLTMTPSAIGTYASIRSGAIDYSNVCSCIGTTHTTTNIASPTSTATVSPITSLYPFWCSRLLERLFLHRCHSHNHKCRISHHHGNSLFHTLIRNVGTLNLNLPQARKLWHSSICVSLDGNSANTDAGNGDLMGFNRDHETEAAYSTSH